LLEVSTVELHPGVFVSNVLTDDWQPDSEVGGEIHVLVEEETAYCGMSRFTTRAGLERWTLPERETVLVLEGSARIEIDGGPTLELAVGDMASLPKGAVTTWHMTLPYREIWFFGRPYEQMRG
jgi:uncharacterized cupin superfamily protein